MTTDRSPNWGLGPTNERRKGAWPPVDTGQGSHRPRHHWAIRGVPSAQGGSTRRCALQRKRLDPRPHCIRAPPRPGREYSVGVDLDAFVAAHSGEWSRLEHLARHGSPSGGEADEILDLYQRVATHLSVVRSSAPDPSLVTYLSSLLARARTRSAGTRSVAWADLGGFFTETFPAALYRTRRWWIVTAAANLAVAIVIGWWFLSHPQFESSLMSPAEIDKLVNTDFQHYYSEFAASHFAAQVWTHNAWLTAICIALGVLGVPVVYLLFENALNLGVVGAIMINHDRGALFFGLILPHGLLELTAVFVAGATGLRLF